MQNMILLLFAVFFTAGSYFILAEVFKVPTYRTSRAILTVGKKQKKQARSSDAFIMELSGKIARFLPMDEYKKRKLAATLRSAEIPMTPELYMAQAHVKAGLIFVCIIPCLLTVPLLFPVFLVLGIGTFFSESGKAEKMVKKRREEIEFELPRFVATITQELMASRDILSMLETYQKNAGPALRNELAITTADMRTGNYEAALTRLEARVSSAMLSDVVRGLIGCIRGDDGVTFFRMLSHDMKQLEVQRLKRLAMERPPKIRRYSFTAGLYASDLHGSYGLSDTRNNVGNVLGGADMKRRIRDVCRNRRGEGYIDVAIGIFCLMLVVALAMTLFPVFMKKQQLDSFADEIVRQAEIVGSTDVSGRIAQLKQETGLDPQIQWDCDYYSGNKVQLNGDIQVTLTQRVDIGFFVFGSFPIELKARASGKSEVYYK